MWRWQEYAIGWSVPGRSRAERQRRPCGGLKSAVGGCLSHILIVGLRVAVGTSNLMGDQRISAEHERHSSHVIHERR